MEQKGECHRDESRRVETRLNWCRRWGYLSFCAVLLSLPRDGALSEKVTTRFRFPLSLSLPRLLIELVCPPTKLRILLLTPTSEQVLLSDKEEEEEEEEEEGDEDEDVALLPASALVGIDDVNVAAAEEGNIAAFFLLFLLRVLTT